MNEIPDDSVLFCVLLLSNEVFRTIAMLLCFVWFDFQVNSWAYFPSNGMLLFFPLQRIFAGFNLCVFTFGWIRYIFLSHVSVNEMPLSAKRFLMQVIW